MTLTLVMEPAANEAETAPGCAGDGAVATQAEGRVKNTSCLGEGFASTCLEAVLPHSSDLGKGKESGVGRASARRWQVSPAPGEDAVAARPSHLLPERARGKAPVCSVRTPKGSLQLPARALPPVLGQDKVPSAERPTAASGSPRSTSEARAHMAAARAQHAGTCHHVLEAGPLQVAAGLQP